MNTLDSLFSWFLVATVRGSLLALAVLCIQAALRGRMPARWRYALWLPVVLVLLAPSLPQSRWSIENGFAAKAAPVQRQSRDTIVESGSELSTIPMEQVAPLPPPEFDWRRAAQVIWLAGAGGLLVFSLAAYARTMRRMRRGAVPADESLDSLLAETTAACGMSRAPRLLVSTEIRSPAVTGLFRSMLLLPADFPGAFTREEARLVLLHELTHLKRHDLPLNWLLCLLQAIHWCNPVLWFVFHRIRADRESACDEQVLAASKDDYRSDYGHALLKLEDGLTSSGLSLGFLGIFERAAGLRSRIRAVAEYRRANPAWAALGIGLIAVLILVGGTRAQDTPAAPSAPAAKAEEKTPAENSDRSRILFQESIQSSGKALFAIAMNTKLQRKDPKVARILNKLQTTVLPELKLREVPVRNAIEILSQKCAELDTTEPDPTKRGIRFTVNIAAPADIPGLPGVSPADARITVSLTDIPAIEALKYVTSLADLKFKVTDAGVVIVPLGYLGAVSTREWPLTADDLAFYQLASGGDAKPGLIKQGVDFPEGTSASVSADGQRLIVKNHEYKLDSIDALLGKEIRSEDVFSQQIGAKLDAIVIPKLEFKNVSVREAINFLRKKSVELDSAETDSAKKGVSIVLKGGSPVPPQPIAKIPGLDTIPGGGIPAAVPGEKLINLSLNNSTLRQALKEVASLAGLQLRVEPYAVALTSGEDGVLISREYRLSDATQTQLGRDAVAFFRERGITFPEGATMVYIRSRGRLIMRNTAENHDRVVKLIEQAVLEPLK